MARNTAHISLWCFVMLSPARAVGTLISISQSISCNVDEFMHNASQIQILTILDLKIFQATELTRFLC